MAEGKDIEDDNTCKILELPDCVLRILFSYLDATSLYLLSQTCYYLKHFVEDPIFWKYIDARNEPILNDKVHYCSNRVHKKTSHLFLKAKYKNCGQVPCNFFGLISPFENIRVLALENQRFKKLSLKEFPTGLEELSLKKTHVKYSENFFKFSTLYMKKLKVLILDECQWVTCSFVMSVSKYENLEIISAVKCLRLHLDMGPYLNLARCKKLKIFDCRFTGIGHELLRSFQKESVQTFYFQSLNSFEADYRESVKKLSYGSLCSSEENAIDGNISDESLFDYLHSEAADIVETVPDTILYRDPYPKCSCGYKDRPRNQLNIPELEISDEDYRYEPPKRHPMKFVCQKHFKDVDRLPNDFKDFFLANQRQFHTDIQSTETDSDSDSSDSENDTACCMYGMGTRMILLTPRNNQEQERDEPVVVNNEEQRNRFSVSIFMANSPAERGSRVSNGEGSNSAGPSTSRSSESDNSLYERRDICRNQTKRKKQENSSSLPKSKRRKVSNAKSSKFDELSDEAQEAQVNELVESAADVGNRLNRIIDSSVRLGLVPDDANNESCLFRCDNGIQNNENRRNQLHAADDVDRQIANTNSPSPGRNEHEDNLSENTISGTTSTRNSNNNSNNNHLSSKNSKDSPNRPLCSLGTNGQSESSSSKNTDESSESRKQKDVTSSPSSSSENNREVNIANEVQNANRISPPRVNVVPLPNVIEESLIVNRGILFINPFHVQVQNNHGKKKLGLRRLSLRGYKKITDTSLNYIKNLNIDLLDLTYTSVTKEGIESFLIHNPDCRIIHRLYCVCKPLYPFKFT